MVISSEITIPLAFANHWRVFVLSGDKAESWPHTGHSLWGPKTPKWVCTLRGPLHGDKTHSRFEYLVLRRRTATFCSHWDLRRIILLHKILQSHSCTHRATKVSLTGPLKFLVSLQDVPSSHPECALSLVTTIKTMCTLYWRRPVYCELVFGILPSITLPASRYHDSLYFPQFISDASEFIPRCPKVKCIASRKNSPRINLYFRLPVQVFSSWPKILSPDSGHNIPLSTIRYKSRPRRNF